MMMMEMTPMTTKMMNNREVGVYIDMKVVVKYSQCVVVDNTKFCIYCRV